jgi:putative membrane protein
MDKETKEQKKEPVLKNVNELAVERNVMAAERNLMAWIRTSLSMITFGFTIYKFMQVMHQQVETTIVNEHAPRTVGLTLISVGTFALIIACFQHFRYLTYLTPGKPFKFWLDLSFIVAVLLGLLGLLMFGNIMLKFGPFH